GHDRTRRWRRDRDSGWGSRPGGSVRGVDRELLVASCAAAKARRPRTKRLPLGAERPLSATAAGVPHVVHRGRGAVAVIHEPVGGVGAQIRADGYGVPAVADERSARAASDERRW